MFAKVVAVVSFHDLRCYVLIKIKNFSRLFATEFTEHVTRDLGAAEDIRIEYNHWRRNLAK
ncbi:hypothetical protein PGB90_006067 [Kerria lacca]